MLAQATRRFALRVQGTVKQVFFVNNAIKPVKLSYPSSASTMAIPMADNLETPQHIHYVLGRQYRLTKLPMIFRRTVVFYQPIRSLLITLGAPWILSVLVSCQEVALVCISNAACWLIKCRLLVNQMPFLCPRDAIPYQLTKTLSLQEMASVCHTDAISLSNRCHS